MDEVTAGFQHIELSFLNRTACKTVPSKLTPTSCHFLLRGSRFVGLITNQNNTYILLYANKSHVIFSGLWFYVRIIQTLFGKCV